MLHKWLAERHSRISPDTVAVKCDVDHASKLCARPACSDRTLSCSKAKPLWRYCTAEQGAYIYTRTYNLNDCRCLSHHCVCLQAKLVRPVVVEAPDQKPTLLYLAGTRMHRCVALQNTCASCSACRDRWHWQCNYPAVARLGWCWF